MKLPAEPFTMAEFEELNRLTNLGQKHYRMIHRRFREIGLVRVRRRREKEYAEDVWVKSNQVQDAGELAKSLRALRA